LIELHKKALGRQGKVTFVIDGANAKHSYERYDHLSPTAVNELRVNSVRKASKDETRNRERK
jgi:hypothetical protein